MSRPKIDLICCADKAKSKNSYAMQIVAGHKTVA